MREITNVNCVSYLNKDEHSHGDQAPPISNMRKQKNFQKKK